MIFSDRQLAPSLTLTALSGIPLLSPGDNLVSIILQSLKQSNLSLKSGDILVIAQKVVSKAEGRYARLADINPSERAFKLAEITGKDPRLVELILSESREIVRHSKGTIQSSGVVVAENHHGVVLANAGIDSSNVGSESEDEKVLLLPVDPDKSAETINKELQPMCTRAQEYLLKNNIVERLNNKLKNNLIYKIY